MRYARKVADIPNAFEMVYAIAKRWLKQCNIETREKFEAWAVGRDVILYPADDGFVLVTDFVPKHRLTMHPLIINPKIVRNAPQMRKVLREMMLFFDVQRIEVRLLETAGHTLRRLLRETGFTHEGTLRAYDIDHLSVSKPLISTEIWSIMRLEILEVSNG